MSDFLFLSAAEPLAAQVAGELAENATQTKSVIEKFFDTFSFAKLVSAAILLVICIVCIKILLKATEKMLKSSKLDRSCHTFIRSTVKIVLVFLAIMLLAGTLGIDTSSLLAILSVAGLAVSLSIQDSLSNLASAVVLLTTHPFKVGDFIEVGGKSGTVRQIGVFHTQIATPDNQLVYLPNSHITSAEITNVRRAARDGKSCPCARGAASEACGERAGFCPPQRLRRQRRQLYAAPLDGGQRLLGRILRRPRSSGSGVQPI